MIWSFTKCLLWKPVHCLKLCGDHQSHHRCHQVKLGQLGRPLLVVIGRTWTGSCGSAGTMAPSLQNIVVLPEHTTVCLPVLSLPLHPSSCPHVSPRHVNLASSVISISLVPSLFITVLLFSLNVTTCSLPIYQLVSFYLKNLQKRTKPGGVSQEGALLSHSWSFSGGA